MMIFFHSFNLTNEKTPQNSFSCHFIWKITYFLKYFQPVRFQLNHASAKQSGTQFTEREYSIWVSELPTDITEEDFKKTFSTRFESLKTGKIFREKDHKVYGFVRFTDLNDQREALIHMNGFRGLGEKPIR